MVAALNAMRVLTDPVETGTVCLCLPQDVQTEAYDYPLDFFKERIHRIDRRPLSQQNLEFLVEKIKSKSRPMIIAGGGIFYSLATKELKDFVEATGIPVAFTNAGNSALPWSQPQNVGGMGVMGTMAANRLAKEADLILAIGTRLMDFTTISKAAFQNPNVDIITININNFDAHKMDAIPILGDAKDALRDLTATLQADEYHVSEEYAQEIAQLRSDWHDEVTFNYSAQPEEGKQIFTANCGHWGIERFFGRK